MAFNTGGLPDIVDERFTGALAEPFDPISLVIFAVVEDEQRQRAIGAVARERASASGTRRGLQLVCGGVRKCDGAFLLPME